MSNTLSTASMLHSGWIWQTTLCLVAGGLASYLLAGRPARAHRLLVFAIAATVAMPLLTYVIGAMNWGLLGAPPSNAVQNRSPEPLVLSSPTAASVPTGEAFGSAGRISHFDGSVPALTSGETAVPLLARLWSTLSWSGLVLSGWLLLTGFTCLKLLTSVRKARRLLENSTPVDDLAVERAIAIAGQKLGLAKLPVVRSSPDVTCPMIWAWSRTPILLLPAQPQCCSVDAIESISYHELAHLKRRDHWATLICWCLSVAVPWQPLIWWAKRRASELSEQACDDWALACGQSPTSYAETLLNLVPQRDGSDLALAAVSQPNGLKGRVAHILDGQPKPRAGVIWTVAAGCFAGLLVCAVAFAQRKSSVETVEVAAGVVESSVQLRGTLESAQAVDLRSELSGQSRIVSLIAEGTDVNKGDLVVEFDSSRIRAALAEQRVKLDLLEKKVKRLEVLGEQQTDAIRKSQVLSQIDAGKAEHAVARLRFDQLESQAAKARVVSPIDGTLTHPRADTAAVVPKVGSLVRERQIVARIVSFDSLHIRATLPRAAGKVDRDKPARIWIDAFPDRLILGKVRSAKPPGRAAASSTQIPLIVIGEFPERARPGMTALIEIPTEQPGKVVRIPVGSLMSVAGEHFCLVKEGNSYSRRGLDVGRRDGKWVEVAEGLKVGERVVANPGRLLTFSEPDSEKTRPQQKKRAGARTTLLGGGPGRASRTKKPPKAVVARANQPRLMSADFQDTPINDILLWLADAADLSLEVQKPLSGNMDLVIKKPQPIEKTIDAVNFILQTRGFTLIRNRDFLLVTQLNAMDKTVVPRITLAELMSSTEENTLVRVFLAIENGDAESVAQELMPLLSRFGEIVPLASSNQLDVFDKAANVRQLVKVIEQNTIGQVQLKVFELEHANVLEVATLLRDLFGLSGQARGRSRGFARQPVDIAPDPRSNRLFVNAPAQFHAVVREVVQLLDTPTAKRQANRTVQVFALKFVPAEEAVKVIRESIKLSEGSKVEVDAASNSMIVLATKEEFERLAALVKKLDSKSPEKQ